MIHALCFVPHHISLHVHMHIMPSLARLSLMPYSIDFVRASYLPTLALVLTLATLARLARIVSSSHTI